MLFYINLFSIALICLISLIFLDLNLTLPGGSIYFILLMLIIIHPLSIRHSLRIMGAQGIHRITIL